VLNDSWECDTLNDDCLSLIQQTDTTFLTTRHIGHKNVNENDIAVQHRGGSPGFVRVSQDRKSIYWPDYSGNRMFQSLG
jgi:hypothetical protein